MRTRVRTINGSSYSWLGNNVSPIGVQGCTSGQTASGTQSWPAESFIADVISERITDEIGHQPVQKVVHRRQHKLVEIHTPAVYTYPTNDPSIGYGVAQQVYAGGHWPVAQNSLVSAVATWDVESDVTLPPRWSIVLPVDETVLLENCMEKASQLKADHLLNVVTSDEIRPTLSTFLKVPKGIPATLMEIWQMKRLAMSMPRLAHAWKPIRSVMKSASSSYLAWKFGVSPVLSDIMATQRYVTQFRSDWEKHKKATIRSFASSGGGTASFDGAPVIRAQTPGGIKYAQTLYSGRVISPPVVRYVVRVKPRSSNSDKLSKLVDLVATRFGSSPASLAWELVPFSFVADWFVDLRACLREIDNVCGLTPYIVVGLSRSYCYSLSTNVRNLYLTPCTGAEIATDEQVCGDVIYRHYERIPTSQRNIRPVWKVRFGKNQARITAALIAQQLSKLRAKR